MNWLVLAVGCARFTTGAVIFVMGVVQVGYRAFQFESKGYVQGAVCRVKAGLSPRREGIDGVKFSWRGWRVEGVVAKEGWACNAAAGVKRRNVRVGVECDESTVEQ